MKRLLAILAILCIAASFALSNAQNVERNDDKIKIGVERMRVLLDMYFDPPTKEPKGYTLFIMDGNVTIPIDVHNAKLIVQVKDKNGI